MADRRPLTHLDADLGNDGGGRRPIDAGNPIQQFQLARVRFELPLEFRVPLLEVAIQPIQPIELHREQLTMVIFHAPIKRQLQGGQLRPHSPLASSAISAGVACPRLSASNISRPERPKTSEATLESLILQLSKSLVTRLRSPDLALTNLIRKRNSARNSPNSPRPTYPVLHHP